MQVDAEGFTQLDLDSIEDRLPDLLKVMDRLFGVGNHYAQAKRLAKAAHTLQLDFRQTEAALVAQHNHKELRDRPGKIVTKTIDQLSGINGYVTQGGRFVVVEPDSPVLSQLKQQQQTVDATAPIDVSEW